MKATFFATAAQFRAWLKKHHATATELIVGFYKRGTGRPSMTWPESVDQALCFGWIDGVRRRLDDEAYTIRFTPRRTASIWSAVNIRRAKALIAGGQMTPAGRSAFERRRADRSRVYTYENPTPSWPAPYERRLRANPAAWGYFSALSPSQRRLVMRWIVSAKKPETRERRLEKLIGDASRQRGRAQDDRRRAGKRTRSQP